MSDIRNLLLETTRASRRCSPLHVKTLEKSLRERPNDLMLRAQLLSFYRMNSEFDPSQMKFARHLLWMVKNFPEHTDIFKSMLLTASCFEAVSLEWENQIARDPSNLAILKNAAHFFCYGIRDFARAERYYLACILLAAASYKIQEETSDFYSYFGRIESNFLSLEKAVLHRKQAIALAPDQKQKLRLLNKVPELAELICLAEALQKEANEASQASTLN